MIKRDNEKEKEKVFKTTLIFHFLPILQFPTFTTLHSEATRTSNYINEFCPADLLRPQFMKHSYVIEVINLCKPQSVFVPRKLLLLTWKPSNLREARKPLDHVTQTLTNVCPYTATQRAIVMHLGNTTMKGRKHRLGGKGRSLGNSDHVPSWKYPGLGQTSSQIFEVPKVQMGKPIK